MLNRRLTACAALLLLAHAETAKASPHGCAAKKTAQSGYASLYASSLAGQPTSSGEPYDENDFTAAHLTLPMNTNILVTNRQNGHSVVLRVNDRGPHTQGRLLDISKAAAYALKMKGLAFVSIKVLCPQ